MLSARRSLPVHYRSSGLCLTRRGWRSACSPACSPKVVTARRDQKFAIVREHSAISVSFARGLTGICRRWFGGLRTVSTPQLRLVWPFKLLHSINVLSAVLQVTKNLPKRGLGTKVQRVSWKDDSYWTVTAVKPSIVSLKLLLSSRHIANHATQSDCNLCVAGRRTRQGVRYIDLERSGTAALYIALAMSQVSVEGAPKHTQLCRAVQAATYNFMLQERPSQKRPNV